MANVEVSTWAELLAAIAGFTDGDTIKLMADIDLTEDYSTGVDKITLAAGKTFIIDGGYEVGATITNHTIKGLSSNLTTPDNIFEAAGATTGFILRNIDFYNLNLAGGDFYKNTDASAPTVQFTNVRFLGKRTGASYLINAQHILLESCYIEMPWQGLNEPNIAYTSLAPKASLESAQTDYTANFCRFVEHYTGWTIPNFSYSTPSRYTFSCSFFKISGCRIEGDMTVSRYSVTGYTDTINCDVLHHKNAENYTPFAMNVFDVEMTSTSNNTKVSYGYWFGVYVSRVKNGNGTDVTDWRTGNGVTVANYPVPLIATPNQAEDAEWLHNNGFDITP